MLDKIYLLNLERRDDKKNKMMIKINENKYLNNKVEIIYAIDGENPDNYLDCKEDINISDWVNPFTGNSITNGEIGCALSHFNMWKNIVENKFNKVLIIEDDVDIHNNFEVELREYFNQIENNNINYDLFYLSRKCFSNDLKQLSKNISKCCLSYWTCGYIITYEGAKKLVESNYLKNVIPVDEFLPICYLNDKLELDKYKYNIENFNAIVGEPYLIKPEINAFQTSDTEISKPYIRLKNWTSINNNEIQVVTVATEKVDGYNRFIDSCNKYNIPCVTLGMGETWEGLDLKNSPGGGHKVTLLKEYINKLNEDDDNKIIIFTDSYDVVLNSNLYEITNKFTKFNCDILFAAEMYCWPDKSLEKDYPNSESDFKYLNSGGIIGKVKNYRKLLEFDIKNSDDDQLYYTLTFLNKGMHSSKLNIKLDYNCEIFQCLNGIFYYIDIDYDRSKIKNGLTNTNPCIIHGNGGLDSKLFLNQLCNYIPLVWRPTYLYQDTNIKNKYFKNLLYEYYPKINIIYINYNNNVSNFDYIINLKYPKNKIELTVLNCNNNDIKIDNISKSQYINIKYYNEVLNKEAKLKLLFISIFENNNNEYIFLINSEHKIENNKIIQLLIKKNKDIIAPMIKKKESNFSNFWGGIDKEGFYKRSFDYFDIAEYRNIGCWNVPYINLTMLISKNKFIDIHDQLMKIEINDNEDLDMYFCRILREKQMFMYICNIEKYGYIIN